MMKKFMLVPLAALLVLMFILLVCCTTPPAPIETNEFPETSAYVPEPLDILIFNTIYENMSEWKKYPPDKEDQAQGQTVQTTADTTAQALPEADAAPEE